MNLEKCGLTDEQKQALKIVSDLVDDLKSVDPDDGINFYGDLVVGKVNKNIEGQIYGHCFRSDAEDDLPAGHHLVVAVSYITPEIERQHTESEIFNQRLRALILQRGFASTMSNLEETLYQVYNVIEGKEPREKPDLLAAVLGKPR